MTTFATLQTKHEQLLARQDNLPEGDLRRRAPAAMELLEDARRYTVEAVAQSDQVADPRERDLLRAYLRYWATFIYDGTGVFPKTDLRPAALSGREAAPPAPTPDTTPAPVARRGGLPGWLWGLLGLLGFLLLFGVASLLLLNRGLDVSESVDPTLPVPITAQPAVTRTPLPQTPIPAVPIDQRNAAQIEALFSADAHTGGALAVAFDPQKPELATGGADGRVRFWTVPTLTLSRQLDDQRGWVRAIDYSPYGDRSSVPGLFLTGGNDRSLRVYELESLQPFADYLPSSGNSGFVFAGRFSPDGRLIASGHGDGVARIWDIASGIENQTTQQSAPASRLAQIPSGGTAVLDVAYGTGGSVLALALSGTDNGVQVVDDTFSFPFCSLTSGPAAAVAFSPRGDLLAAGTEDGRLLLITATANGCQVAYENPAHEGGLTDIAFSPTGDWLVTSGRDGVMKIWSVDGNWLADHQVGAPVAAVAVSPDAGYIASADENGRLILWGIP
ncbi:MAG: hypothetical protein KC410_16530 [Anaerolineales bacterium]|nr:hypothetical protein [Anaerolineales bacterium]